MFSDRKVFPRRRFDPLVKAAAVKAYTLGLSLRQVAAFLGSIGFNVGRESVSRWFLKAGEILSGDDVKNRCTGRPTIYTDRGPWYIWPAKVLGIRHRGDVRYEEHDRTMVLQAEEKDKTVQHILPHIQYKNDREVDKGMDSLKLTVSS